MPCSNVRSVAMCSIERHDIPVSAHFLQAIEKEAKAEIDAAVNAAKEAPEPELEESYTEVLQELVPVRGRELGEMYSPA